MANEFKLGEDRENFGDFYSDVFWYLICAVECGRNPKFMYGYGTPDAKTEHYEFLRYKHVSMLVDAIKKVCKAAVKNVESHGGKLSFESVEEMDRYRRDVLIAKKTKFRDGNFGDNVILAIDGIPKNKQAFMLRGLARYMRFCDYGKDYVVDEKYMLDYADYLMNVLIWICDNQKMVWRTMDFWANRYGYDYTSNHTGNRKEFLDLPDYYNSEHAAFVRARLIHEY